MKQWCLSLLGLLAVSALAHVPEPRLVSLHDALYRVTGETINGGPGSGSASYTYDPVGNRTARNSTLAALSAQSFGYDANDRLTSDSYDANGNTLFGAGFAQAQADQYDFENRLVQRTATVNGQFTSATIIYNGDGTRVAVEQTKNIYDRLPGAKTLEQFSSLGHGSAVSDQSDAWRNSVRKFLDEQFKPTRTKSDCPIGR